MKVLLDTCALLALVRGELPAKASRSLQAAPDAYVSVVSAWEVALKVAAGRIRLATSPIEWFEALTARYDLRPIPLDARTACVAAGLPTVHRDPFDRILVALARSHALTVLTSDDLIPKYPDVTTVWS